MSYQPVHEETYRGLRIKIVPDDSPDSPDAWGNTDAFLVHFHRQFQTCPKWAPVSSADELVEFVRSLREPEGEEPVEPEEGDTEWTAAYKDKYAWCMAPGPELLLTSEEMTRAAMHARVPVAELEAWAESEAARVAAADLNRRQNIWDAQQVYDAEAAAEWKVFLVSAYIHSGVSLSVYGDAEDIDFGSHRCLGWDTSLVGAVFIRKTSKAWGEPDDDGYSWICDGATKRHTWAEVAESVVSEWNDYLAGNIYGFVVEDETGTELDSRWGFYGNYSVEGGCLAEARSIADSFADERDAETAKVDALVSRLEAAGDAALDEAVHSVFSEHASAVNNGGAAEQVAFLQAAGWSLEDIRKAAESEE